MPSRISTAGLLCHKGRFFLARRRPGGAIGGKWEFPGGKAEPGETARDALAREWKEELEINVSVGELVCSGEFTHYDKTFVLEAYRITADPGAEPSLSGPGSEHQEAGWFTPEEMTRLDLPDSDRIIANHLLKCMSRPEEWRFSE